MALNYLSLDALFVGSVKALYSAEQQLIVALPKMAKAARSPALQKGLNEHLKQTKHQVERIEEIFASRQESLRGRKNLEMERLILEGEQIIQGNITPAVKDAGLIAAAQRVEHYEIASYGIAQAYAQNLGYEKAAQLLQLSLNEESQTTQILTALANKYFLQEPEN